MTDKNVINPDLLQPEDAPTKTKRTRKPKVAEVKIEEPAVKAKETASSTVWSYNYNHPEYDMYMAYQKYFEQQQKSILEYWTTVMRNIWNPWNTK